MFQKPAQIPYWYSKPVTIYVQRHWTEYEDAKPKSRSDQQSISKSWIETEKVSFLFGNLDLRARLVEKLPKHTTVSIDDHTMVVRNTGPALCSDEYRQWWTQTIRTVFEISSNASAYLCYLDQDTPGVMSEYLDSTSPNVSIKETELAGTHLIIGTGDTGRVLFSIQTIESRVQLVNTEWMKEVRMVQMPKHWNKWFQHLTRDEAVFKEAGILDILILYGDEPVYLAVDIDNVRGQSNMVGCIENILITSSHRTISDLQRGEHILLSRPDVRKYIEKKLNDSVCPWFVSSDENINQLVVLAVDQNSAENLTSLIRSSIEKVEFKLSQSRREEILLTLEEKYAEKMCWISEKASENRIKVYITDDLRDDFDDEVGQLGGCRSMGGQNTHPQPPEVISVHGRDRVEYMRRHIRGEIPMQGNALNVQISFEDVSSDQVNIIIFGAAADSIRATCVEIQSMVDDIKTFKYPEEESVFTREKIDQVKNLEKENRCVIATCMTDKGDLDNEDEPLTYNNFPKQKSVSPKWWICGQARVSIATGPADGVGADAVVSFRKRVRDTKQAGRPTGKIVG